MLMTNKICTMPLFFAQHDKLYDKKSGLVAKKELVDS